MIALALAMSLQASAQEPPDPWVHALRPGRVDQLDRRRRSFRLGWSGGTADVFVIDEQGRQTRIAASVPPPYTTPPLPAGSRFLVRHGGGTSEPLAAPDLLEPVDFAAWSGRGLRGARVSSLVNAGQQLWIATLEGGLSVYDGQRFLHADHRSGLPSASIDDLVLTSDGSRWLLSRERLVRVDPSGAVVPFPGRWTDASLTNLPDASAWLSSPGGLWRLEPTEGPVQVRTDACGEVLYVPDSGPWALCDEAWRPLAQQESGSPHLPAPGALRTFVLDDALWNVVPEGLLHPDDGLVWRPPSDGIQAAQARVGQLFLAAGHDGLFRMDLDSEQVLPVVATQGYHVGSTYTLAAASHPNKMWVGGDGGVALVAEDGQSAMMPLAPLAAGLRVVDVAPSKDGVAVLGEQGLSWLGRRAPRGWRNLVEAAGTDGREVLQLGRDWWVRTDTTLLRLDQRGDLQRFDTGASTLSLDVVADRLVVSTTQGMRWWVHGATRLSSASDISSAALVQGSSPLAMWRLGSGTLHLATPDLEESWSVPGASAAVAVGFSCWVLRDGELFVHQAGKDAPERILLEDADLLVSLASAEGALIAGDASGTMWALRADGRIFRLDLSDALSDARLLHLVPDGPSLWIATSAGLFRAGERAPWQLQNPPSP